MKRQILAILGLGVASLPLTAETVAFEENFDTSGYTESFPTVIDTYGGHPADAISSWFMGQSGAFEAWWPLKDYAAATDRYIASHSYYSTPGKSGSYLVSRAIEIPTTGFVLTFGAQSYETGYRPGQDKRSDLWVYVTEEPVSKENLPTEAAMYIEKVSVGRSAADIASDFPEFELNLDAYAGKSVYITFANLNEDMDILAIDNVKVARADRLELTVDAYEELMTEETYRLTGRVTALQDVESRTLTLTDNHGFSLTTEGGALAAGEEDIFSFDVPVEVGATSDFRLSLTAPSQGDIVYSGSVSRMAFRPERRVFVEEITGTWCGNCPVAAYNVESMLEDPVMGEYVVPVAVHIPGAKPDKLVCEEYSNALGVGQAPMFRINRGDRYIGVGNNDLNFDPANEYSFAYQVALERERTTFFDISLEGEYDQASDAFDVVATVTSALPVADNRYSVGFVLTENNVWLENTRYWCQTNYYSGYATESHLGGWTELPEDVYNVRFHDVARGVWGIVGLEGALPSTLDFNVPYKVEMSLPRPQTEEYDSNGKLSAPAIVPEHCNVIAYVVDTEEMTIMNVATLPMSETANERMTIREFADLTSVEALHPDGGSEAPVYYDLTGRRVDSPARGIYIERRGSAVRKVVI